MMDIVNTLFDDPVYFFEDWESQEADVIAALELLNISSYATDESSPWTSAIITPIRNWKKFSVSSARLSLGQLSSPTFLKLQKKLIQSVTSIEVFILKFIFSLFFSTMLIIFFFFLLFRSALLSTICLIELKTFLSSG